jgi:recombination protein RecA
MHQDRCILDLNARAWIGEYKANIMPSAVALRSQIETTLAARIPAALTPAARVIREVMPTGVAAVDEVLRGGLPVGALTEMVGAECSGRTSLALKFVAEVTKAEKVCAWVDASDALSPESAAACGVDLARLLWVRCGVVKQGSAAQSGCEVGERVDGFALPEKYFVPKPVVKGLHGGGMGGHPRGEAKGMDAAVNGLLQPDVSARCAEPQRRVRVEREAVEPVVMRDAGVGQIGGLRVGARKPWSRIEQALKVTDLLLQAGGFAAIVLDMGSLAPEHVSRIPLATWFRYRAAAERNQASVVLLTQYPCAKSSAGLVLRMQSGDAVEQGGTVLSGFERRVEVSRRRFEQVEEKVVTMRKPPQRAGVAAWQSQTAWAGRG